MEKLECYIDRHKLTDGSRVYAVVVSRTDRFNVTELVVLDCFSEYDAIELQKALTKHALVEQV